MKKSILTILFTIMISFVIAQDMHEWAIYNRAEYLYKKGEDLKALIELNHALIEKPDFKEALLLKSTINMYLSNCVEALSDLNKVKKIDSLYPELFVGFGSYFNICCENMAESYSNYSKAIELKPNYGEAYLGRSYLYEYLNIQNWSQKAINDLNKAVEFSQDTFITEIALYNRARIKIGELNDSIGACEDWKTAMKLGDNNSKREYEGIGISKCKCSEIEQKQKEK